MSLMSIQVLCKLRNRFEEVEGLEPQVEPAHEPQDEANLLRIWFSVPSVSFFLSFFPFKFEV